MHLPARDQVLSRLVPALKPGGWLVCEEFDRISAPPDPGLSSGEIALKTHEAMGRVHHDQGVAPQYGRLLFGRLREIGLDRPRRGSAPGDGAAGIVERQIAAGQLRTTPSCHD